jgi:hypothetical protein
MPQIIPLLNSLIDERDSVVKLAQYAQMIGMTEDGFWGVSNAATSNDSCKTIWGLQDRVRIARYLKDAQEEIERLILFPLTPRWITDEQQYYASPVHAKWRKIIEGGFRNTADIQLGAAVSHVTDPAVVIAATLLTDESEIAVFHPGTDVEIYPSDISIAGNVVTILIPRARMVTLAAQDNPSSGLAYATLSNFEATVDIKRVFNDVSIQAGLVWAHRNTSSCDCGCEPCCGTCGDYTETACEYILNPETGAISVLPASWSGSGGWSAFCPTCYCEAPTRMILNYRAGLSPVTEDTLQAVVSLAHAKMPTAPCGCDSTLDRYRTDIEVVEFAQTRPFGLNKRGAFRAMDYAQHVKSQNGFVAG